MIAKFIHGANELDLNTSPYTGVVNFTPPTDNAIYNIGMGTSANRLNGGKLISTSQANRQLNFGVRIMGSSQYAIEGAVRRLQMFLDNYANVDTDPVYFQFLSTAVPLPLWGQLGQPLKYEVVTCNVSLTEQYSDSYLRRSGMIVNIALQVKPVALGIQQRVGSAIGAVVEDNLGQTNGIVRGLRILPAGDNNSANPRFTHGTWNNGWTAGSNIIEVKNTDLRYVYPGASFSARLTSKGATNNAYTESVNVGNTNNHIFWVIAKRQDGAAVSSDDLQYTYDGTAQATTFTSLGDGFYACEYSRAGEAAAKAVGIVVKSGRTVYLCHHIIEESAVRTYPGCGLDLGWAWAGTAHASASTRTAGRVRIPVDTSTFNIGHGAIAMTWKTDYANDAAGDRFMFSCGSTSLRAYYQASDDKFYFTDHTNTISTAAQTFSAGDVIRLIFVWGASGLAIYKNGSSAASGATFTPPANPTYVYIGTDDSAANHASGVVSGFTIEPQEPTAAEISAIDALSSAVSGAGYRVDYVPWLWTKDGDNVIDNCDDGTYDNWAVSGGVAGNLPAVSSWWINPSVDLLEYFFFHRDDQYFISPTSQWFGDLSGTAEASTACGDASFQKGSVGGLDYSSAFGETSYTVTDAVKMIGNVKCFIRAKHSVGDVTFTMALGYSYTSEVYPTWGANIVTTFTTAYRLYHLRDLQIDIPYVRGINTYPLRIEVKMSTTGGTSGTVYFDYVIAWLGNMLYIPVTDAPSSGGISDIYISDGNAQTLSSTAAFETLYPEGDKIELVPDKYNLLMWHNGGDGENDALNSTATFDRVLVTPRWKLL